LATGQITGQIKRAQPTFAIEAMRSRTKSETKCTNPSHPRQLTA
jgi:hypothetical protein